MYLKVTTTQTRQKTYRYVKLIQAKWNGNGAQEKVIATLGTIEDVLKSRDTIIRGLTALSIQETSRQKRRSGSTARVLVRAAEQHQTKKRPDIRDRCRRPAKGSRGKSKKNRRSKR